MTEKLYRWHWRDRLPERHGQAFRVLATARGGRAEPTAFPIPVVVLSEQPLKPMRNACLVEFLSDGARYVTLRYAGRDTG